MDIVGVVYSMWVLEYFALWYIFWSGAMKHFEPKIYKEFELYQVFMDNFLY